MSDTTQLDIFHKIAEAMARTGEPKPTAVAEFCEDHDVLLGEVPMHLRHIHNLISEIGVKLKEQNPPNHDEIDDFTKFMGLFFSTLATHVPVDPDIYRATKLCHGWKVAGVKRTQESEPVMRGIAIVL